MVDYKKLYFSLYARVADLTEELTALQQEIEEQYLSQNDDAVILEFKTDNEKRSVV